MSNLRKELDGEPLWGLPHFMSEEMITAHDITPVRWLGHCMYLIILCSGFVFGGFWLWPYFEGLNKQNALTKAVELNGLMYDTNYGFSFLVGVLVWIIFSVMFTLLLVRLTPMPIKGSLIFGTQTYSNAYKISKQVDSIMETDHRPRSTSAMLNKLIDYEIKSLNLLTITLPLTLLSIFLLFHETKTFSVYTEDGYFRAGFLSEKFKPWSELDVVELGCNQTDSGGSFVYKVHFSRQSVRVEDGTPILDDDWITTMEKLDSHIEAAGVPFKRWKWLKRDPLAPKCLRGFYGELGPEGKNRLDKLLRLHEF